MVHLKEKKLKKKINGQNVCIGDKKSFVRFEVLMAVIMKIKILWDVILYTLLDIY
jgi:hypothetical protein